jgi:copper(I)-binding protein
VKLEPGASHLVLQDVREVIRGGDFMQFTMRFESAKSITLTFQSQVPFYDERPSPA